MSLDKELDYQLRIVEYTPNLTEFNKLAQIYVDTSLCHKSAWFRMNENEAIDYFGGCLRLYALLNLRKYRLEIGKNDPSYFMIQEIVGNIAVPQFFRDAMRELVRPILDGVTLYIPKFDNFIVKPGTTVYDALNIKMSARAKIFTCCTDLNINLVTLDAEMLKPAKFSIYVEIDNYSFVAAHAPIPEFRRLSLSILKHFRFEATDPGSLSPSDLLTTEQIKQVVQLVNQNTTSGFADIIGMRVHLNSIPYWTRPADPIVLPGLLSDRQRFPTEDNHSVTPPQSPHFRSGSSRKGKQSKRKKDFEDIKDSRTSRTSEVVHPSTTNGNVVEE